MKPAQNDVEPVKDESPVTGSNLLKKKERNTPPKLRIDEPLLHTVPSTDESVGSKIVKKKRRLSARLVGAFRLSNRLSRKPRSNSKSSKSSYEEPKNNKDKKKARLSARISHIFTKKSKNGANSTSIADVDDLEKPKSPGGQDGESFKPKSNRTSLGRRLSGMFSRKVMKSKSQIDTEQTKSGRAPIMSRTLETLENSSDIEGTRSMSKPREELPSVLLDKEHNLKIKKMREDLKAKKKMKFISPLEQKQSQLEELAPKRKKKRKHNASKMGNPFKNTKKEPPTASEVEALLTPTQSPEQEETNEKKHPKPEKKISELEHSKLPQVMSSSKLTKSEPLPEEKKKKILEPGRVRRRKRKVGRLKGLKKEPEEGTHVNTLFRIFAKMNEKEKALLTPSNAKKRETLL